MSNWCHCLLSKSLGIHFPLSKFSIQKLLNYLSSILFKGTSQVNEQTKQTKQNLGYDCGSSCIWIKKKNIWILDLAIQIR